MNIILRTTREDEIDWIKKIEAESFGVQSKYFENGVLPSLPPEDAEYYALNNLYINKDVTMLSIYLDDKVVGCVVVKDIDEISKDVLLFFVLPEHQGYGLGRRTLQLLEEYFPNTKKWKLITPTQIIKNAVFYVNKCGYKIVSVEDFDKRTEHGVFVFEKIIDN